MNFYSELAAVREDVEKYLLPHEIIDEFPVRLYEGEFKKIPVWVYWHQGFGSAPDIVKLCVASIMANIPDNCELILLDKYNIGKYTKLPDYVVKRTKKNYTHSSNMLRAALLYLYGGMWIDATFLLTDQIPASCFENDYWFLKDYRENPENEEEYVELPAIECIYSKPGNEMLFYLYNMLCNYWRYNEKIYHYFLKDGVLEYGYRTGGFPKKYIDDVPYTNLGRYNFFGEGMNCTYSPQEYKKRVGNTIFFKQTYKFKVKYYDYMHDKITFYKYFKTKYLPTITNQSNFKTLKKYTNILEAQNNSIKDIPNPECIFTQKDKIPVWTFWYQGEENAPDSVKICLASMRKYFNQDDFSIIVLNKDNIKDYINLPQYVIDRVGTNYTHLSDIMRYYLLYAYGGLWIDATYLFTKEYFTKDLLEDKDFYGFTFNLDNEYNGFFQNIFYMKPKNDICLFCYKTLCSYWKNNAHLMYYYLNDCCYYLGYKNKLYDLGNDNNICPNYDLHGVNINKKFSRIKLDEMSNKMPIFKLTYKQEEFYQDYYKNELTFYGYFKEKFLKENGQCF